METVMRGTLEMEMAQGTTARCKRIFDFQQLYETFGAAKEHRALNTTKLSAGEEPMSAFCGGFDSHRFVF